MNGRRRPSAKAASLPPPAMPITVDSVPRAGGYSSAAHMTERHRDLQRYVRFTSEDSVRVVAAYPFAAPHLNRVSDIFYERIREHEEANAVLRDEAQVQRLRGSMVKWLADLFLGPHDAAHFARAARVGQVHVNVGLPARYMVTAMNVIRGELVNVLAESGKPRHAASVALLLDVELAVMLDSYWDHYSDRLRRATRPPEGTATLADVTHAIEHLGVIVVGLDARSRIMLFNDEAERTTGYARDEILGKPIQMLFPPEEADALETRLGSAQRDDAPEAFDAALVTRVGRLRDVRARIKRAIGGPRGLEAFLTASDVTEEIALQKRTHQAERLAAIGRLAAGLAHEIRNPLNGAQLHLTLLERTLRKRGSTDSDDALEAVHTVAHEVKRLSALVTEFLQFARPQPLTLRPLSVGGVCQHAVRLLGPDAARIGIDLTLDLPLSSPIIRGDRDKLSQVLINLIRNAMEAVESAAEPNHRVQPIGHVVIRVRRQPRDVLVEIEDDGPGIAKSDAPIFDAFFSTKPTGTGLGLPIAHRIVQDHGGTLTFDSRTVARHGGEGRLTTFRMKLPVLDHHEVDADQSSNERPHEA